MKTKNCISDTILKDVFDSAPRLLGALQLPKNFKCMGWIVLGPFSPQPHGPLKTQFPKPSPKKSAKKWPPSPSTQKTLTQNANCYFQTICFVFQLQLLWVFLGWFRNQSGAIPFTPVFTVAVTTVLSWAHLIAGAGQLSSLSDLYELSSNYFYDPHPTVPLVYLAPPCLAEIYCHPLP